MTNPIRILLVDDHAMVREGLRAFLQWVNDVEIIGEAGTGQEAFDVVESKDVDVVLMDLVMPGEMDGIACTRAITEQFPDVHVIALTSFQDEERVLDALSAGAVGYIRKDVSPDDLLATIRQTMEGRTVLEETAMEALRRNHFGTGRSDTRESGEHHPRLKTQSRVHFSRDNSVMEVGESRKPVATKTGNPEFEPLTNRELEILRWLAKGFSNKEIGAQLGITEKTVKVHVSHILAKMGVYDRTQAVIVASRTGLVQL